MLIYKYDIKINDHNPVALLINNAIYLYQNYPMRGYEKSSFYKNQLAIYQEHWRYVKRRPYTIFPKATYTQSVQSLLYSLFHNISCNEQYFKEKVE